MQLNPLLFFNIAWLTEQVFEVDVSTQRRWRFDYKAIGNILKLLYEGCMFHIYWSLTDCKCLR